MSSARLLLVDDHQIMRDGLRLLLAGSTEWEVAGSAFAADAAWSLVVESQPDLVLMDLNLPGECGVTLTERIRRTYPQIKVLVLTGSPEPHLVRGALAAGANGYLLKSDASAQLKLALRTVLAGQMFLSAEVSAIVVRELQQPLLARRNGTALTERETQILTRIADGDTTKEIAFALGVSAKTVETHRLNLMAKLEAPSVAALTKYAVRAGLATL